MGEETQNIETCCWDADSSFVARRKFSPLALLFVCIDLLQRADTRAILCIDAIVKVRSE